MRAAFGKVNTLHNHVLPWTDRPLVIAQPGRRRRRHRRRGHLGRAADSEPVDVPRSDRPGVPRRLRPRTLFQSSAARRSELRRPPARLSGPHRSRPTSISASRSRTATTRRASCDGADIGALHDESVRRRRDVPLAAAAALDLPLVHRPHRMRSGAGAISSSGLQNGDRLLRVGRLSVRAALVRRRRASTRRIAPIDASLRDTGGSLIAHLLAERVQPGARPVPAHQLRARPTANEFLFQFQFSIGAHGAHPF